MPFQPTVFGQLMKCLPRKVFLAAVVGRKKWGLTDWAHLVTLVAAQVTGARSLRDLVRMLDRHRPALVHLGVAPVRRSTLADANASRPSEPFEAAASHLSAMVAQVAPEVSREALRLIDATRIHAGKRVQAWAVDGAIKVHVVFDPVAQRTTHFAVSSSRTNDITAAKRFPIERGATYVFDRGYYCFTFWANLAAANCTFVTRAKRHTQLHAVRTRKLPKAAPNILGDRTGLLPTRLGNKRQNPFTQRVRTIDVTISTDRVITLLTNDLTAPATEIADLYKSRWGIELFFKWIKQNLKLATFLGASKQAITLQIIAALIAHLLVRLAQLRGKTTLALQALFRLIAHTLFQRRPIEELMLPEPTGRPPPPTPQHTFGFAHG